MAPVNDPKICVLVILDNPTGESYYGGRIVAPVAGRIIEDVLTYLEVEKKYTEKDMEMMAKEAEIPDIVGKTVEEARSILQQSDLYIRIEGDGESGIVEKQMPKKGEIVEKGSNVVVYIKQIDKESEILE